MGTFIIIIIIMEAEKVTIAIYLAVAASYLTSSSMSHT